MAGRPKSKNPRNKQYRIRFTKEEYEQLKSRAKTSHMKISEYIRAGLFGLVILEGDFVDEKGKEVEE